MKYLNKKGKKQNDQKMPNMRDLEHLSNEAEGWQKTLDLPMPG